MLRLLDSVVILPCRLKKVSHDSAKFHIHTCVDQHSFQVRPGVGGHQILRATIDMRPWSQWHLDTGQGMVSKRLGW